MPRKPREVIPADEGEEEISAEENPLADADIQAENIKEYAANQAPVWEPEEIAWDRKKDDIREQLAQPVPAKYIKQLQGYDYIDGAYVIRKLNELFGVEWDSSVINLTIIEAERSQTRPDGTHFMTKAPTAVWATVEVRTQYCRKQDVGVNAVQGDSARALDTAIKGAATDGLKRAARQLGEALGLSLYPDVTSEHEPKQQAAPQQQAPRQQAPAPQAKGGVTCDVCGVQIKGFQGRDGFVQPEDWANITRRKAGQALCYDHWKKWKNENPS